MKNSTNTKQTNAVGRFFNESFTVLWADLRFLRRFWKRTLFTSLLTPLLYLLAFGFGLGSMVTLGDGQVSYLLFVIPGIIAITAMNTAYNSAGNKLSVDKLFYKSFDEIMMAPISVEAVVFGKGLVGVLRGVIACGLFIILGLVAADGFMVNWQFLVTLLLSLFAFSFMGVAVGVYAKTHQDMTTFSSVFIMPMSFLGGTFFDPTQLPVLFALPLTNSSYSLREAAGITSIEGEMAISEPAIAWLSILYLLLFSIICFIAARWQMKKLDF